MRPIIQLRTALVVVCLCTAVACRQDQVLEKEEEEERGGNGPTPATLLGARRSLLFQGASSSGSNKGRGTFYRSSAIGSTVTDEVTLSAWVKIRRHKRYNWVAGTVNRSNGWALFIDEAEKACFGLFKENQLKTISTRSLQIPKAWHFVSGVFRNGTIQVFVDAQPGEVVPLKSQRSLSVQTWKDGVLLGGSPNFPTLRLDGEVAGVQLWEGARSSHQLAEDMVSSYQAGATPAGLVALWPLVDKDGVVDIDVIEDVVGGQNMHVDGSGEKPEWRVSDAPVYVHAEWKKACHSSNANQSFTATASIGVLPHRGKAKAIEGKVSYVLDKSGLAQPTLDAKVELETELQLKLGRVATKVKVPSLPWPLIPGRYLTLTLRADFEEKENGIEGVENSLCTKTTLQMVREGKPKSKQSSNARSRRYHAFASQAINLVVHRWNEDGSSPRDYARVVELCHFAGQQQSLIRRKARESIQHDLSLLVFSSTPSAHDNLVSRSIKDEVNDAAEEEIVRNVTRRLHEKNLSLQCLLFKVGARSSWATSTHEAIETIQTAGEGNDGRTCLVFHVQSASEGLKIAQTVSNGNRTMLATLSNLAQLPRSHFMDNIFETALEESNNLEQRIVSIIPSEGEADILACSPSNPSHEDLGLGLDLDGKSQLEPGRSTERCEVMDQTLFARTIISAIGGSLEWWPLFIPRSLTILETKLLRSIRIEDASQRQLGAERSEQNSAVEFIEIEVLLILWKTYLQIIQQQQAWDNPGIASYKHHVYKKESSSSTSGASPNEPGVRQGQQLTLDQVLFALQGTLV